MVSAGIEGSPSVQPLTLQVPIQIDPQCYELPTDYAGVVYKIGDGIGSARFMFGHIVVACAVTSITFIVYVWATYCIFKSRKRSIEKNMNQIVKITPKRTKRNKVQHKDQLEEMGKTDSIT